MSIEAVIGEVQALVPGDHIHLDEVMAAHPAPGARGWMGLLTDLAGRLAMTEGRYSISLPVGEVEPDRAVLTGPDAMFDLVSEPTDEPPSVHRSHDRLPTPWLGQRLSEASAVDTGVVVIASLSRSPGERDRGEPWYATITFAIGG